MRILATLAVLTFATTAFAQAHHRTENKALLGIVAVPKAGKDKRPPLTLAHVLKKSPAAKAGLKRGDEIQSIGGTAVHQPADVDAALEKYNGGEKIEIQYRRDGKDATATAKLIQRRAYKGDFLKRVARGKTRFPAPEWFVYSWAQAGEASPTLAAARKKVIVIHCFQSW